MSDTPVRFERRGTTAVVTLDNPATRNSFTSALKEGMAAAIAQVKADSGIRAVVIAGANGAFCAGGDLRGIAAAGTLESDGLRARMHGTHAIFRELLSLDRPVIAAVDGAAGGAHRGADRRAGGVGVVGGEQCELLAEPADDEERVVDREADAEQ